MRRGSTFTATQVVHRKPQQQRRCSEVGIQRSLRLSALVLYDRNNPNFSVARLLSRRFLPQTNERRFIMREGAAARRPANDESFAVKCFENHQLLLSVTAASPAEKKKRKKEEKPSASQLFTASGGKVKGGAAYANASANGCSHSSCSSRRRIGRRVLRGCFFFLFSISTQANVSFPHRVFLFIQHTTRYRCDHAGKKKQREKDLR